MVSLSLLTANKTEKSPPDKISLLNINFLTSQLKHMLWVLQRSVTLGLSFEHPKQLC